MNDGLLKKGFDHYHCCLVGEAISIKSKLLLLYLSAARISAIQTPLPDSLQFLIYVTLHNFFIFTVMFKNGVSDNVKVIQSKQALAVRTSNISYFCALTSLDLP